MSNLDQEFIYYKSHQNDLIEKYNGRWIVIKDKKVVGDFSTQLGALKTSSSSYKAGTFIIQYVEAGKESYSQTFHSRVAL